MAYKIYIEPQGKSYPYDTNKTNGSLEDDPKISSKIKPIDRSEANSEIEKNEILLDPETGAMHKALGKPHTKGGTPVSLKNNSFIFSNYKPLAITKNEKELFEFKLGGKYKAINNTPAKVLGKEVDLEHHNKMIDILQNEKKYTKETVNSAKLMMMKNLEKAGQIAFLQESKKQDEIPQFAQGTAPVYSKNTDEQITQSMQYLQMGGLAQKAFWDKINQNGVPQPTYRYLNSWSGLSPTKDDSFYYKLNFNKAIGLSPEIINALIKRSAYTQFNAKDPIIQNMASNEASAYQDALGQKNKINLDMYLPATSKKPSYQSGGRKLTAAEIAQAEKNPLTDTNGWRYVWRDGRKVYYDKPGTQSLTRTPPSEADTKKFNDWFSKQTPAFQADYIRRSKLKMAQTPGQFGFKNTPGPLGYTTDSTGMTAPPQRQFPVINNQLPTPVPKPFDSSIITKQGTQPGNPNGIVDPTTYNSKLTPWQLINMGIPFYKALTVKTQYPLRQHQESVIPQMENINVQPQLDQNNQAYFNAASLTKEMNPNQGSAFTQQLYGNRISANNQAIGTVQQANVQTQNNQKVMAANSLNQDAGQNRLFDKNYYDSTQIATKNASDLREAYFNQGMNISNDTISKKLAFDSFLNSQQQYKGKPTYIDKDGVQHYQGKALYEPVTGFFGNSVKYSSPTIDWSTYAGTGNKIDSPEELGKAYQEMLKFMPGLTPDAFIKSRTLLNYNTNANNIPPSFKMGGKFRVKQKKSSY